MTQTNAAAERSAHVERGPQRAGGVPDFLVEVAPGVYRLRAVVEAWAAGRDAASAELRAIAARMRALDPTRLEILANAATLETAADAIERMEAPA